MLAIVGVLARRIISLAERKQNKESVKGALSTEFKSTTVSKDFSYMLCCHKS